MTLAQSMSKQLSETGKYAEYLRSVVKNYLDLVDHSLKTNKRVSRDRKLIEILDENIDIIQIERTKIFEMNRYLSELNLYSIDSSEITKLEKIASEMNEIVYFFEQNGIVLLDELNWKDSI